MKQAKPIFIISGVPGAGKSSVANALMGRFDYGIHIPVDDLREFVVAGIAHPVPEWTPETGRQFELARVAAAQVAALYNQAGFAVAIDDVISPSDARAAFDDALDGRALHKVLLHPNLDTALERSASRTSKPFDPTVLDATIRALHASTVAEQYGAMGWQVIDSSALTLEQTVDQILEGITQAPANGDDAIDRRGKLDEEVFSYRATKDKVFISWHSKQVMVLKGQDAARFLSKMEGLEGKAAQLVMAKITGHFKHGNER